MERSCARSLATPRMEKPSTLVVTTTPSAAFRAATLPELKPGGQSKIM